MFSGRYFLTVCVRQIIAHVFISHFFISDTQYRTILVTVELPKPNYFFQNSMMPDFFAQIEIRLFVDPPPPHHSPEPIQPIDVSSLVCAAVFFAHFLFQPSHPHVNPIFTVSGSLWTGVFCLFAHPLPANTEHRPCAGSMLGQRCRRWPNIEPAQVQYPAFSGLAILRKKDTLSKRWCNMRQRQAEFNNALVQYQPETLVSEWITPVQIQKAVSAHFTSKQILPFGFAE